MNTDIKKWRDLIESSLLDQTEILKNDPYQIIQMKSVDSAVWSDNQLKKAVIKFLLDEENRNSVKSRFRFHAALVFNKLKKLKCPWPELKVLESHAVDINAAVNSAIVFK